MRDSSQNQFVYDGIERVRKAHLTQVTLQVRTQYEETLKYARFWKRYMIEVKIRREIREELDKIAPLGGLF